MTISNVTARANGGIFVTGHHEEGGYIRSLTLENIHILMFGGKDKSELNAEPPFPYYPIYGFHSAPYAVFIRNVEDLELRNLTFEWNTPEQPDWGAAVRCFDIEELEIDGFDGRQSLGSDQPAAGPCARPAGRSSLATVTPRAIAAPRSRVRISSFAAAAAGGSRNSTEARASAPTRERCGSRFTSSSTPASAESRSAWPSRCPGWALCNARLRATRC